MAYGKYLYSVIVCDDVHKVKQAAAGAQKETPDASQVFLFGGDYRTRRALGEYQPVSPGVKKCRPVLHQSAKSIAAQGTRRMASQRPSNAKRLSQTPQKQVFGKFAGHFTGQHGAVDLPSDTNLITTSGASPGPRPMPRRA